jgi:hypothetical protein
MNLVVLKNKDCIILIMELLSVDLPYINILQCSWTNRCMNLHDSYSPTHYTWHSNFPLPLGWHLPSCDLVAVHELAWQLLPLGRHDSWVMLLCRLSALVSCHVMSFCVWTYSAIYWTGLKICCCVGTCHTATTTV